MKAKDKTNIADFSSTNGEIGLVNTSKFAHLFHRQWKQTSRLAILQNKIPNS